MSKMGFGALAIPIILSLASCGESESADSADSSVAATDAGALVVRWDETAGCVYEGPPEIAAGPVTVNLVNNGEDRANIGVWKLDVGTVQDVKDLFVTEPRTTGFGVAGVQASDMGAVAPADPGETLEWKNSLTPGEYVLLCNRSRPFGVWFGSGLTVFEG